jgi:type II secretory pathway component GspD/PulD (secretin)
MCLARRSRVIRALTALFACALLIPIAGDPTAIAAATQPAPSLHMTNPDAQAVATVPLFNIKAADVAGAVQTIYPEVRCAIDVRSNSLIVRGPSGLVAKARALAVSLDGRPANVTVGKSGAPDQEVRVFPLLHPESGPQIATALTTFVQGLPAAEKKAGSTEAAPTAPPSTVILAPSQAQIIVRSDARTLNIIAKAVLPALQNSATGLQAVRTYDVRFAVPNPSFVPGTLTATSSISDLAAAVQTIVTQTGTGDVHVTPDPSYPRILVSGSQLGVNRAMKFLHDLDRRPALVDVLAQVYEINENRASDIGIQLPTGSIQTSIGEYFPPTTIGTTSTPATPPPVFQIGKITKSPLSISAQLNLLIQQGNARLIATPHVATVNGRQTSISVTNTIPFVANSLTPAGVTIPGVKDYQTGTKLEIIPMINIDGSISAYVHPWYTTLTGLTAQQAPLISTREVYTTFRLQSGQAAYISGLEEITDASTVQKIPGLWRIPLFGQLFRNKGIQYLRTQLFIVLTASVIDPGDLPMTPLEIDPSHPPIPKPRPYLRPYPAAPPINEVPYPAATPTESPVLRGP